MQRRREMRFRLGCLVAMLVTTGLALPGCVRSAEEPTESHIVSVDPITGTDLARVTLSADAARRLDVQTAAVRESGGHKGAKSRMVIPYAAVLYDANGDTWTYTNPKSLVFVRSAVSVDTIHGREAVLSEGPPVGTKVVTVGASELLGAEYRVGEE
jgi:hypothetical protein